MSETEIKTKPEEVKGRIFIKGKLKNISPLAVSNGDTQYSDADIYRDDSGVPVVPGTSFMGALKSLLKQIEIDDKYPNIYKYLFGFNHKKGTEDIQSHFIIDDLKCTSKTFNTNVRDGVKIDPSTNLAVDKGKYDYEILESGHTFSLSAEVTLRQGLEETKISEILNIFGAILNTNHLFQVGSLTSFGFGQVEMQSLKRTDILSGDEYFEYLKDESSVKWKDFEQTEEHFDNAIATFQLELVPTTPLFIGGGKINTADADDASLQSNGKYILSAKSLKGAVRHQAYRIANTVHGKPIAEDLCNLIFGNRDVDTKKHKDKLTKSKFWTSDAIIEHSGEKKSQARVAIDRFTGGAIESALFATEPVWPMADTSISVKWRLTKTENEDTDKAAIGLLLFVARDLLTEMLPVGGDKSIGRGRFTGELDLDCNGTSVDEANYQEYINAFINYEKQSDDTK